MKKKDRYAVNALRKLFTDADKAGKLADVWQLVTAMRGPDKDDTFEKKDNITTPIRRVVLTQRQARELGVTGSWSYVIGGRKDSVDLPNLSSWSSLMENHFEDHAFLAKQVINDLPR